MTFAESVYSASPSQQPRAPRRRVRAATPFIAVASALALVLGVAAPASATGMLSVRGNISCTAYPNIAIDRWCMNIFA